MRKLFLSVVAVVIMFATFATVSCQKDDAQNFDYKVENGLAEFINGDIPLSKAMANAEFVYRNTEGIKYKTRRISSVDVLTTSDINSGIVGTRSSSSENEAEQPLAYVVNYENNGGYAILAADTKLPPVISLCDEGNFSTEGFIAFMQNSATTRTGAEINPAQEVQYAVINNSLSLPTFGGGNIGVQMTGVDTTIMLKCMPLVLTKWGQYDPYNYYAPLDGNVRSLAGCVPVAGAQTLASLCYHHNWRPSAEISEEFDIDWYAINRMIYADSIRFDYGSRTPATLATASLIRAVGDNVDAKYHANSTGAYTEDLVSTYQTLGMTSATYGNENSSPAVTQEDIFDMIVIKNYPVTTRASRVNDNGTYAGAHSFVLDGWLRLEYTVLGFSTSEGLPENVLGNRRDNFQYNFDLVHVNFGWDGECDGYYLPDAFDLTEDKYHEFAEENDINATMPRIYDLDVKYLIYNL